MGSSVGRLRARLGSKRGGVIDSELSEPISEPMKSSQPLLAAVFMILKKHRFGDSWGGWHLLLNNKSVNQNAKKVPPPFRTPEPVPLSFSTIYSVFVSFIGSENGFRTYPNLPNLWAVINRRTGIRLTCGRSTP